MINKWHITTMGNSITIKAGIIATKTWSEATIIDKRIEQKYEREHLMVLGLFRILDNHI